MKKRVCLSLATRQTEVTWSVYLSWYQKRTIQTDWVNILMDSQSWNIWVYTESKYIYLCMLFYKLRFTIYDAHILIKFSTWKIVSVQEKILVVLRSIFKDAGKMVSTMYLSRKYRTPSVLSLQAPDLTKNWVLLTHLEIRTM